MHHVNKFTSFKESNIVSGGISPSKLDRIFRIHKRAYKVILGCNVDTFFDNPQDLKIFSVFERLFLRKA